MKTREVTKIELLCEECEKPLGDINGFPYWSDGDNNYCANCALKNGVLSPLEYANEIGFHVYQKAEYSDGCITAFYKCGRGFSKDIIKIDVEI